MEVLKLLHAAHVRFSLLDLTERSNISPTQNSVCFLPLLQCSQEISFNQNIFSPASDMLLDSESTVKDQLWDVMLLTAFSTCFWKKTGNWKEMYLLRNGKQELTKSNFQWSFVRWKPYFFFIFVKVHFIPLLYHIKKSVIFRLYVVMLKMWFNSFY